MRTVLRLTVVAASFAMMTRWHRGGIYSKNLAVILGVLQSVYSSSRDGYRIYSLTIADVNALGKHLDKEKGQDDPQNRVILEVLEKISDLEEAGDPVMEEVALHAAAVRNSFFDDRKKLEDVIPPVLMVSLDDRKEVRPGKYVKVESDQPAAKPKAAAKPKGKATEKK